MSSREREVVVAGGGFAGMKVAEELRGHAHVTMVNPRDRFTFKPLVHELLSETSRPRRITRDLMDKVAGAHVRDRVTEVREDAVVTAGGDELPYDDLVVAVGAEPAYFGVPGAREHALDFWSLRDGLRGNARLKELLLDDPRSGDRYHVTVVGAGLTGLEVATEVAAFFERYDAPYRVNVPELRDELFPHMTDEFARKVEEGLERYHVNVLLGTAVQGIRPGGVQVTMAGDEVVLPSDLSFWCAGIQPREVPPLSMEVDWTCASVDVDRVWIVGDCARFPRDDDRGPVPRLAQTAEQAAEVAARNIRTPDDPVELAPKVKGTILSLGPRYAVAEMAGGMVLGGRLPWHVKKQLYKWHLSR